MAETLIDRSRAATEKLGALAAMTKVFSRSRLILFSMASQSFMKVSPE
jgi:hypothetical protein